MTFGPMDNAKMWTWIAIGVAIVAILVILWLAQ
jgi:hypothetical protein